MRRNRRCGHQAVHGDSRMAKKKCNSPEDSEIQKNEKTIETQQHSKVGERKDKGFEVGRER